MNALKIYAAHLFSAFPNAQSVGHQRSLHALFVAALWLLAAPSVSLAQREYTVVKPRERAANESVVVRTVIKQPTEGVLVVVLDPIIPGKVVIESTTGSVITEAEADETGQAEFTLPRGKAYRVKASAPGFTSAAGQSKPLQASDTVRLKLTAQFASLKLRNLPPSAQVLIDDQTRATVDQSGAVTIADLAPGNHTLTIRHPEYNDFRDDLGKLEAGEQLSYAKVPLVKVAKLTLQALPGAAVLIDGERVGQVQDDGKVTINYQLAAAAEHTIAVELVGYEPWSRREMLAPGARTIAAKLEPVVTSAGVSDFFDDLSLWAAPQDWKIRPDRMPNGKMNNKLVVSGMELGLPKGTIYRDFQANFTVWLADGKGAAWAVRLDKSGKNYYLFYLAGPNAETPKKFYTYLVRDGKVTQASTPSPVLADLNQKDSFTIDITVQGFTIKHEITSLTGEKNDLGIYTDTTDSKTNFLYGTFGFRSFKGESFVIDDFHIQPTAK
jgi:hypothetical protein